MFFWLHAISSIIAALLIIYLSLSCKFGDHNKRVHKYASIVVALSGVISLIGSLFYGFTINFSINSIHYLAGFISLILSLLPFLRYFIKSSGWHYLVGDVAAIFAVISLVSGFIVYHGVIVSYFTPVSLDCLYLEELLADDRCLVVVDELVYDMSSMPRWESGQHFDYACGGVYDKSKLPDSHEASKYYGPVIGRLCQ